MTNVGEQLKYALRGLRRAPGFALMAIALLALGIAATSAVFSVSLSVLLKDLVIREQHRVVALWATGSGGASEVPTTLERYGRFSGVTTALVSVAGYTHYGSGLSPLRDEQANARYAREALVTGNFFDVLGTRPIVGRLLRPDDDVLGAAPVMVISESYWRRAFGADPGIVGHRLEMLNRETTAVIIGVAPAGVDYPTGTEYWLPIVPTGYPAVDLIGRLSATGTEERARAEFSAFIANDTRAYPNDLGARSLRASGVAVHSLPDLIVGPVRQPLIILSAAVLGLLLIACVNVGNLLLVRATARAREIAIRRALGARAFDIVRQLTMEVMVLTTAGALAGVGVAFASLRILVALAPPALPRVEEVVLSPVAVALTTIASAITVFVAGVLPPCLFGLPTAGSLRIDSRSGPETPKRRTLRSVLVATQIALALVLLSFSGLLVRSLARLESIDLGFVPEHLSVVQLSASFRKYRDAGRFSDALDEVRRQLRSVPGVTAVSPILDWPFLGTNDFSTRLEVRGSPELSGVDAPYVSWDAVGPDFARAMGLAIVRGRGISDSDREGAARVVVVTQDLADRYWPGNDPLGKQLRFPVTGADTSWRTVVGVIKPLNYRTFRRPTPTVLFAYRQQFQQGIFLVRSTEKLSDVLSELRRAASASDRDIALWRAETMDQLIAEPLGRPRFEAVLAAAFGAIALLVAAAGLYGVTAYLVRQQTREFAIRVALGATSTDVLRLAFGDALRVSAFGALAGVGISLLATRIVAAQLFELSATDPLSLIGAGVVLMFVTIFAAYLPARHAGRIDAARALRSD